MKTVVRSLMLITLVLALVLLKPTPVQAQYPGATPQSCEYMQDIANAIGAQLTFRYLYYGDFYGMNWYEWTITYGGSSGWGVCYM